MAVDVRMTVSDMDVEFYLDEPFCMRHGILRCSQLIRYITIEVQELDRDITHYITILGRLYPFEKEGAILKMKIEQTTYPRIELKLKLLQIGSNRYKIMTQEVIDLERRKFYKIKKIAVRYSREHHVN